MKEMRNSKMNIMKGGISVHTMEESIIGASEMMNSEEYF